MRLLLGLLLAVLCSVGVPGQGRTRTATVTLDDGTVLNGDVVRVDVRELLIEVDGTLHAIPATRIRTCKFETVASAPSGSGAGKAAPPAASAAGPPSGRLLDRRLHRVRAVFPWVVPETDAGWASAGIALLLVLGVGVHLAARIGGAEGARWRRGFVVAAFLLGIAAANLALVPAEMPVAGAAALGSVLLGMLFLGFGYGLSFGGALVALFTLVIEAAASVLCVVVVDTILHRIGSDAVN